MVPINGSAANYGMVISVYGSNFQWYFAGPKSFSGVLQRSQLFGATEPILPNHQGGFGEFIFLKNSPEDCLSEPGNFSQFGSHLLKIPHAMLFTF